MMQYPQLSEVHIELNTQLRYNETDYYKGGLI